MFTGGVDSSASHVGTPPFPASCLYLVAHCGDQRTALRVRSAAGARALRASQAVETLPFAFVSRRSPPVTPMPPPPCPTPVPFQANRVNNATGVGTPTVVANIRYNLSGIPLPTGKEFTIADNCCNDPGPPPPPTHTRL
jgi:hypothetical protein